MRTTILDKNQLTNASWKKGLNSFHWLEEKRAAWKKFFEIQQAIFELIFR